MSEELVNLTFPDGAVKQFAKPITGAEIAQSISKSLSKKALAFTLDGVLHDLTDEITQSGTLEIITRKDPLGVELIRHDCAHVLAHAVQILFPDTQVTIGPVIANGFFYDFAREVPFSISDLELIEKKMRELIRQDLPFRKEVWSRNKAIEAFKAKGEHYKVELIEAIPENEEVKIYYNGDWFDLCRGPHMPSLGHIGNAFKLTKVAGAYWRGDSNNPMLTRIYGVAFADEAELKAYLLMLEEAEKRDHRKLGREMDLFHLQEEGPGLVFWHPTGWRLYQNLVSYMRRKIEKAGYKEVNTPQFLDKSLWEQSGHWEWYRENMFKVSTATDNEEAARIFVLKPMNCPGHVQIFKHGLKSYRDLPVRYAEFGLVHRYEPSGSMHGLLRVRGFVQDDAHVFCTADQIAQECLAMNDIILRTYTDFGFEKITIKLSTRPEKRVGEDALWDKAEDILSKVLEQIKAENPDRIETEIYPGEGAFYGPKFEYTLTDAIGREWQCGTIQLDFNLPGRFGAFYIDRNSEKQQPVMIHRAVTGSLERFLGILIEHYAGNLPLWLAPVQIVVATITSEAEEYAKQVVEQLEANGLQVKLDVRNEKISYKIREHALQKVPVILVCGAKEAANRTINMRRRGSKDQTEYSLDEAVKSLAQEATPPDLKA